MSELLVLDEMFSTYRTYFDFTMVRSKPSADPRSPLLPVSLMTADPQLARSSLCAHVGRQRLWAL